MLFYKTLTAGLKVNPHFRAGEYIQFANNKLQKKKTIRGANERFKNVIILDNHTLWTMH